MQNLVRFNLLFTKNALSAQNIEQMITQKATIKTDSVKVQSLIYSLEHNSYTPTSIQASLFTQSSSLSFYFSQLHQVITPSNLVTVKKYETLSDGLYILLKGQISFMFSLGQGDREMTKSRIGLIKSSAGSAVIGQPMAVFECSFKNSTALEESFLLKVSEEQAVCSKFYQFYNRRKDLYDNHYLPSQHHSSYSLPQNSEIIHFPSHFGAVFSVNYKIHSNFCFKKYVFRQKVTLNSIGVIADGKVRLRGSNEIEKYGVMLPNIGYEVTSAELEVMIIKPNQSLVINVKCESQQKESKDFPEIRKKCSTHKNKTFSNLDLLFSKKEKAKRQKDLTKISKQSESYSIISSFLCNKSLDLIHKQNLEDKGKNKKEERCKNPLILFNIVNEKSRLATPNFSNIHNPVSPSCLENSRAKKIAQQAKENLTPNYNLLRKLRLPFKDYQRMQKKNNQQEKSVILRSSSKAKSLFTLTAGKTAYDRQQEEQFVRYKNQKQE